MPLTDDLERLAALHARGALNDAEFANAKARTIGGAAGDPRAAASSGSREASWLAGWRRSRSDRWLGGVCGGLAPVSGLPSWVWRLVFLTLVLCAGTGVMLYVLLWILLPDDDGIVDAHASYRAG